MRSETNPQLAIRTVLVSARAAVRSNMAAGDPVMARWSAIRGMELLEQVARHDASGELMPEYEEAQAELRSLAGAEGEPTPGQDPPLPSRTRPR